MLLISWTQKGWEEYLFWQNNNKNILKKINRLIDETIRNPTSGLGEPERLKYRLTGFWSRRIDSEHRLVYKFDESSVIFFQCRYHYQK